MGLFIMSAQAALITIEPGSEWAGLDFKTATTNQMTGDFTLRESNTTGVIQSFTATENMTVGSISFLALRLTAGKEFGVSVYELFSGDGVTPQANPARFYPDDPNYSSLIKAYSLTSSSGITTGSRGDNFFTVSLVGSEQFDLVAGKAYGIHLYSEVVGGSESTLLIWNYAGTDVYSGGTYGVPGAAVAARDLGLALNAIPEPMAAGMLGIGAFAAVALRRLSRRG